LSATGLTLLMTEREFAVQLAKDEVLQCRWAVTRQYLSVNQVVCDESGPVPVRVDESSESGAYSVYFSIQEELYYLVVVIRSSPAHELKVASVYMEARVYVRLVISSSEIAPEEISQRIGLIPSSSHERGDPHGARGGRIHKEHLWIKEPLPEVPASVEEKIKTLLKELGPVADRISALYPMCQVSVSIGYHGWGGDPQFGGFHFDVATIRLLYAIGAELDINLYSFGPEMPEVS
jgi:hypothetical protein